MSDRDPRIEVVAKALLAHREASEDGYGFKWGDLEPGGKELLLEPAAAVVAALDAYEREHPGLEARLFAPFETSDGSDDVLRCEAQAAVDRWLNAELDEHTAPESVEAKADELHQWSTGLRILAGQAAAVGMGVSAVLLRQIANEAREMVGRDA